MLAVRDILVPVDFYDTSVNALGYAAELARAFGARLHVLHVLEDAFALPAGTEGSLSACPRLAREAEEDARRRLGALVSDRSPQPMVSVRIGNPAPAIVAHAEHIQASLIVMGTHGLRSKPAGAIGSVAAELVGTAPCPVLTIRRQPNEALVAVERSQTSNVRDFREPESV